MLIAKRTEILDRRVIRTKQLIELAFVELLSNKSFEAITVSEICDKAMINRSTFYNHYVDKYVLLRELAETELFHIEKILANHTYSFNQITPSDRPDDCFYELLNYTKDHKDRYLILFSQVDKELFSKPFSLLIERSVIDYLGESSYLSIEFISSTKILKCFLTNAIKGMLKSWLQHSTMYTPYYYALQYTRIVQVHMQQVNNDM